MNFKMRIMLRAVMIRLKKGEAAEEIFLSYPRLSEAETAELKKAAGLC